MSKRTVGDLLNEKFLTLQTELKKYIDVSLFPTDISTEDVCFYISNLFLGINTDEEYKNKIIELIELNGVNIDKKNVDVVITLVCNFVRWFKTL